MFRWLFLNDNGLHPAEHTVWKISALRIILFSGFALEAMIAIHSSIKAIEIGAYHVVWITCFFYTLLTTGIYYSARRPQLGAAVLLFTVYGAGACIVLFIDIHEISKLGIIFVYATPLIGRLFFGSKTALALMLFNFLPFFLLLKNEKLPTFSGLNMTLEFTHTYIQSLVFLFFNGCVPLAVFRVLHALDAASSRHRETSEALTISTAQYREVFEHGGGPTMLCDNAGYILQANALANRLLGRAHDGTGDTLFQWLRPCLPTDPENQTDDRMGRLLTMPSRDYLTRNDTLVLIENIARTTQNNFILALRDISNLRLMQDALHRSRERETFLSSHDLVTGLPNRSMLRQHLASILLDHDPGKTIALVSLRLNSIRHANEKHGASVGDQLIRHFSVALTDHLPTGTFCARLRSIVFSFVIDHARSPSELMRIVERIQKSLPHKIDVNGHSLLIQISLGIALTHQDDLAVDGLIRRSEVALDSARQSKDQSIALFDEADAERIRRSVEIESAIVSALCNDEFRLAFQPKLNRQGTITGAEALIRWHSPSLGEIHPAEFIPIAECAGLINDITRFVIGRTCNTISQINKTRGSCPPLAINLSARDLVRHDLIKMIEETCLRHGIAPASLEFEITETGLILNEDKATAHLNVLHELGFTIAIDDFGTGYSSLSKLSTFPVHNIKIDRSFIKRIGECKKSELIVKAIVSLAEFLSCTTTAEGVETEEQEAFLHGIACTHYQGFRYFHPLESEQFKALLSSLEPMSASAVC